MRKGGEDAALFRNYRTELVEEVSLHDESLWYLKSPGVKAGEAS